MKYETPDPALSYALFCERMKEQTRYLRLKDTTEAMKYTTGALRWIQRRWNHPRRKWQINNAATFFS